MPRRGRRRTAKNRGGMRRTRIALMVFGFGVGLGFVIVVGEFAQFERVASAVMALGLVMLPLALFADGRGMVVLRWIAARFSRGKRRKARAKSRPAAARRNPQASPAITPAAPRAARAPRRSPR